MVEKTVLDCGLTVLSERRGEFPSVALSFTLKEGSRHETRQNNGIHHLIEHLLFKGSRRFDQRTIADISDRLGGHLNAYTSKEITQFYLTCVDDKRQEAFELLADLVLAAQFPQAEFAKEKNVIVQEIHESDDTPDSFAFELFYEEVYPGDPLGFPIAGKEPVISAMTSEEVVRFYRQAYRPENLVLAATGAIDHRELVAMATRVTRGCPAAPPRHWQPAPLLPARRTIRRPKSDLQQVYLIAGFPGYAQVSPKRYAYQVMNEILGAGMSSRLFQRIREDRGLAYTVSSFPDAYLDSGLLLIFGVVEPGQAAEYHRVMGEELRRIARDGVSAEELARARDHLKASLVLGLEGNSSAMRFHINHHLYEGRDIPLAEIVSAVDAVTVEAVAEVTREILAGRKPSLLAYGPLPDDFDPEAGF